MTNKFGYLRSSNSFTTAASVIFTFIAHFDTYFVLSVKNVIFGGDGRMREEKKDTSKDNG